MGASAASNQAKDVIERGGTNEQAFWGGLNAGAAEALFEKVSIDRLLSVHSVSSMKDLLKETVKQAGVEASEEMLTEISNILTDAAIMGDKSNFAELVEQYEMQGLSEDEAKRQALLDSIGQGGVGRRRRRPVRRGHGRGGQRLQLRRQRRVANRQQKPPEPESRRAVPADGETTLWRPSLRKGWKATHPPGVTNWPRRSRTSRPRGSR